MYLGLLSLSIYFCRENILDYMEGKTGYSIAKEQVGFEDIPTICFCLSSQYNHGENFVASVNVYSRNKYFAFYTEWWPWSLEFELTAFQQKEAIGQCYKISPKWKGSITIDFTKFGIDLILTSTSNITQYLYNEHVNFFVTSEKNSYGLVRRKWFDGNLDPNFKAWSGGLIRITKINEYRNLEDGCTEDSYYECLARRMMSFDMRKISIDTLFDKLMCANLSICTPGISLPAIEGNEIQSCPKPLSEDCNYPQLCSYAAMNQLINDQSEHCNKCCNIKDFHLEIDLTVRVTQFDQYLFGNETRPYWVVRFEFDSPMTSLDSRMMKPFKTVHEEYLIVTWITLIGNVGGTMGMFVGFSIIGTSELFIQMLIPKIWNIL